MLPAMRWMLAAILLLLALPSFAADSACGLAVRAAERRFGVPPGLLQAISLSESGRWNKETRTTVAWPWAVTAGTESYFLPDKPTAVATVERLRRQGRRNIDVGCMQVNLMHHPEAFADLDSAFDPDVNADYGAKFLASLRDTTRSWARAVERYHSADPERGRGYRDRVYDRWHAVQTGRLPVRTAVPRLPNVHRPTPPRLEAASASLFASAGPRWQLAPMRPGPSFWASRTAAPLIVRGRPLTMGGGPLATDDSGTAPPRPAD